MSAPDSDVHLVYLCWPKYRCSLVYENFVIPGRGTGGVGSDVQS